MAFIITTLVLTWKVGILITKIYSRLSDVFTASFQNVIVRMKKLQQY